MGQARVKKGRNSLREGNTTSGKAPGNVSIIPVTSFVGGGGREIGENNWEGERPFHLGV